MSDDLQCDVEVNPGVRCQRKLDHYGSHVAYTLPSTPDGREPTKERGDGTRESAYTRLLDYLRYVEPDLPSDGRKLLLTDLDLLAGKLGDGTPGPAREAAACCRTITPELEAAAFAAFDNWTPDLHGPDSRGRLRAALRVVLASGDSGGPREAAIEQATKYLRDFIQYEPGTTMRPQREKADSCLSFILSRLRAELARAPNDPRGEAHRAAREVLIAAGFGNMEAHVLRAALKAAYAADSRARVDAERREPAP